MSYSELVTINSEILAGNSTYITLVLGHDKFTNNFNLTVTCNNPPSSLKSLTFEIKCVPIDFSEDPILIMSGEWSINSLKENIPINGLKNKVYSFSFSICDGTDELTPDTVVNVKIMKVNKHMSNGKTKIYYEISYDNQGHGEESQWAFPTDTDFIDSKIGYRFDGYGLTPKGATQLFKEWNKNVAIAAGIYGDFLSKYDAYEIDLYPYFTPNTYNVYYDGNGATSGNMKSQTATYDKEFITNKCAFIRTGYRFIGWKDNNGTLWGLNSSGVYESGKSWIWSGAEYTKNITLQAQWEPYTLTINYLKGSNNETSSHTPKNGILLTETFKYDNTPSKPSIYTPKKYLKGTEILDDNLWVLRLGYTPVEGAEWIEKDTKQTIAAGESYSAGYLANSLGKSINTNDNTANLIVNWEVYGLVNIYTNDGWKKAVPYIYTDKGWERAVPYIYTDKGWTMGG